MMIKTLEAIFDGKVFQPDKPVEIEPNTRVRISVEALSAESEEVVSFLRTARSLNLEGPPDWSTKVG
jgi:predicted DNA-binding antitoxin AbrB/MazE fold protein